MEDYEKQEIKISLEDYSILKQTEQRFDDLCFFLQLHIDKNKEIDLKELAGLLFVYSFNVSYNWEMEESKWDIKQTQSAYWILKESEEK